MNHGGNVKVDAATSSLMDALRGVSAMIVACVHGFQVFVLPYSGVGSPSHILTSLLATHAVTMFFIVSGFMIVTVGSSEEMKHRNVFKIKGCVVGGSRSRRISSYRNV